MTIAEGGFGRGHNTRGIISLRHLVGFFAVRSSSQRPGATAVEYGLMVGLIAVVIIGTVATLGDQLNDLFEVITTELEA